MPLAAFLVSAAAFLSAFLGGLVALRAVSRVGIIIAIGAGIRIGAAFFDLIERFRNPDVWTRRGSTWMIDGFLVPDWRWA